MAWYKRDIITQRPKFGFDGCDQRIEITFREIGATDTAIEQHVADKGQTGFFAE